MIKRKPGRPAKLDPNRRRITIDQAVNLVREYWSQFNMPGYSKGYIYNLSAEGKLEKTKCGRCVFLFEDDVRKKLCG